MTQSAVSRWISGEQRPRGKDLNAEPPTVTLPKPHDGRPPLLTDDQLRAILASWPPNRRVTGNSFRAAIRETHGVSYSLSHACGLLKYLGGTAPTRFNANRASGASA